MKVLKLLFINFCRQTVFIFIILCVGGSPLPYNFCFKLI